MACKKVLICIISFLLFIYKEYGQTGTPIRLDTFFILAGENPFIKKNQQEIIDNRYPITSFFQSGKTYHSTVSGGQAKDYSTARKSSSIDLTIDITDATCGKNNGILIVTATNGTSPYTYEINNWGPRPIGYFPTLTSGTYSITVRDASGGLETRQFIIPGTNSPPVLRWGSYTNPSGCGASDGSITLAVSGGTPPYSYSMDGVNYQSGNVFNNLDGGYYHFYVTDANGCTATYENMYGASRCQLNFAVSISTYICQGSGSISVLNPSGGVAPYIYSIDGINYVSDNKFTNLDPGTYHISIKDASGKIGVIGLQIIRICEPHYTTIDAACNQNDGSITVTAQGGTPPYMFTIDGVNYQTSNVFSNLVSSYYSVSVKDATGKISSLNVFVDNNCPVVTAGKTNETCGLTNGTITASGSKGTSPYQYSIDGINFQNSNIFAGLNADNYIVTIKDANGNKGITTVTVMNNCLTVTATPVNVVCSNHNGSIIATGNGGTTPYQYSINGINFQTGNLFTGLAAGTFNITIKDATGATSTTTASINDSPGPTFTTVSTPASCRLNDGGITINATGGTSPLEYSVDKLNFQGSSNFGNLYEGQYTVSVKDANGCIIFNTEWVSLYCLTVSATATEAICGKSNGTISITANNGVPPYEYSIDGITYQTGNTFTGMIDGSYTIYVRDAKGSVKTGSTGVNATCVTVTAISENEICGNKNGRIVAIGADGTAPYLYSIDAVNFQNSGNFTQLAAGSYTVTIKDTKGLTNSTTVTVGFTSGPQISASASPTGCSNQDGVISVSGSGGILPLQYSIDGTLFSSSTIFSKIPSGTYNAIVKDINGCMAFSTVIVPLVDNLLVDAGTDVTICEGASNVLSSSTNGTSLAWTPSTGLNNTSLHNPTASPVTTTKYYVTASFGPCTRNDSMIVFVNPAPAAITGTGATLCYGQSTTLQGSGGVGCLWTPATYLNNSHACTPVVNKPANSITYQLTVKGVNGCPSINPAMITVNVTPPAVVFAGNDTSIMANQPFPLNALDVNNSGFTQYTWSPAIGLSNAFVKEPIASVQQPITYTVTATTAAGCEGVGKISINAYPGPEIYVPNAFTPNGDGHNDVLKPVTVGIKEFRYFAIYNRWGQRVFFSSRPNLGWDGQVGAHSQNTNTFVWKAAGIDYKGNMLERKGVVVLIR